MSDKNSFSDQDQVGITKLFLKIRDRAIHKEMTEKIVAHTIKIFLRSLRQMNIDNMIELYSLSMKLRPFKTIGILLMFNIKVVTYS